MGIEHMEVCEADEAEMWTVYGRHANGEAVAICDCVSQMDAESVEALLNWMLRPDES